MLCIWIFKLRQHKTTELTKQIPDAQRIGWDLLLGTSSPFLRQNGTGGRLFLSAARVTVNLQSHLPMADLPNHLLMDSFRVGGSPNKSCGRHHESWWLEDRISCKVLHQGYLDATSSG